MTKVVKIGNVTIGGGAPIAIQSMTNTDTRDVVATINQIDRLARLGADLVRVTVPDYQAATAFGKIARGVDIPLIADIHFDSKLAIAAIKEGAAKIRINPGNTSLDDLKELASVASDYNVPIRIGVNRGSIKQDGITAQTMVDLCADVVAKMLKVNFNNLVLAVKSSSVAETIDAYRLLAKTFDYPLHIGLTEAGVGESAVIRSSIAIGTLLSQGIGDTIRVSLAGAPEQEIIAAKKILNALELRCDMPKIIACPTCGRTVIDVENLAKRIEDATKNIAKPIKIAVMGCIVNGLGEGRDADIGIAGGQSQSIIFKKGTKIAQVNNEDIESTLLQYIGEIDE